MKRRRAAGRVIAGLGISAVIVVGGIVGSLGWTRLAWGQGDAGKSAPADVVGAVGIAYPVNTTKTGMVSFVVTVAENGKAEKVQVGQDVAPLTAAAQASLEKWTYQAASANGKNVSGSLPVYVVFNPYNPGATSVVGGVLQAPRPAEAGSAESVPAQIRLAAYASYPVNSEATGTVVLSVSIDKWGHASRVKVVHGAEPLSDAAVAAVKEWGFQPAMRGGEAEAGRVCVAFVFQRNLS